MTAIDSAMVRSSAYNTSTYDSTVNVRTDSAYNSGMTNQVSNGSQLSGDTFYKLLAAQLQYQDPMASVDNTEMILQMAQFAVIEQMSNLNTQFSDFMISQQVTAGAAVVDKEVTIALGDTGEESIKGKVEEVGFSSSGTIVKVNGQYYEFWRIVEIRDGSQSVTEDIAV